MTDWKETTLGVATELAKSQWKPGNAEEKYIGLEHINQGDLVINGFGSSVKLESNKFFFKKGDILFGKLRPYFRKVWRAQFDGVCSTDIWVIRAKSGFDQGFLFYFFSNPIFIDRTMGASTGTRMPRADWDFLQNLKFKLPSLEEQREIANVLSSLDYKIELLREENKTLEATAQAIFKEWFVNFNFPNAEGKPYKSSGGKMIDSELGEIPEWWSAGKYQDIVNVVTGKGIKKEDLKSHGLYQVLGANGEIGKTDNFLFDEDLILTGRVGTLGTIYISQGRVWISDNVLISKSKTIENFYFTYFHLRRFNFEGLNRGSTQSLITQTDLKNVDIVLPTSEVLKKWHNLSSDLFNKIFNNNSQIQALSTLRDTLLPKLMSGEIRVENAKLD